MPKVSNIFSGSFLRAADLDGPRDVTIVGWHTEYAFGKEEYVLDLEGEPLGLRLTATLGRDIRAALGGEDDLEDWIGRVVRIYPSQIKIRENDAEKIIDLIRAMKSELDKPSAEPPAKALRSLPDDDIPF